MISTPSYRTPETISVVVCAYTRERWTDIQRAVESLRSQAVLPKEIILVCDHNEELLALATANLPDIEVVANAHSRGLSGARNTGTERASGDVVAFLDDDASAEPDWTAELLAAYGEPNALAVFGSVVPRWQAPRPAWMPEEFLWVVGCTYRGEPLGRADVRNGNGASMSFRREVLAAIGGFDSAIGRVAKNAAGCEETELSIRARRIIPGGRIIFEPRAVCRHTVTAERVTRTYFRRRCAAEGRSKAIVSGMSGAGAALSTERAYVRKVLPAGVLEGIRGVAHGDRDSGARALSIVEGLAVTASAYVGERVSSSRMPWRATAH